MLGYWAIVRGYSCELIKEIVPLSSTTENSFLGGGWSPPHLSNFKYNSLVIKICPPSIWSLFQPLCCPKLVWRMKPMMLRMHTSISRTFKNVTLFCPQELLPFDYVAILKRAGVCQPANEDCWVLLSQKRFSRWEPAALILTSLHLTPGILHTCWLHSPPLTFSQDLSTPQADWNPALSCLTFCLCFDECAYYIYCQTDSKPGYSLRLPWLPRLQGI